MAHAFLGLGSNLGDRLWNLRQAVLQISKISTLTIDNSSPVYETQPQGYSEQGDFLNAVVEITFELTYENLLHLLQKIELALGRKRTIKWGPRTIDIDILAIDCVYYNSPQLKVPHPELAHRLFVLKPFNDIAANYSVFALGKTVHRLLEMTKDKNKIRLYMSPQTLLNQPKEV